MPPLRYLVPNTFTAFSLLLGLWSCAMSMKGHFELAAWMILWGTLLDKADGTAARLFKATSQFGVQFDSFADFVAFGIAPAMLLYFRVGFVGWREMGLMLAAGLYVLALAIRLSRFNLMSGTETVFHGIPGTLMGAVIAAGYLGWHKYALSNEWLSYAPAYLIGGGVLMVSSLRLPKLRVRKSRALNVFQLGNVVAAYVFGPLMIFPEYLFFVAVAYLVIGVMWCFFHREEPLAEVVDLQNDDTKPQEQAA